MLWSSSVIIYIVWGSWSASVFEFPAAALRFMKKIDAPKHVSTIANATMIAIADVGQPEFETFSTGATVPVVSVLANVGAAVGIGA